MITQRLVFHGFESPAWLAVLGLFLVAEATLIVLLFRYERQLITRRLGNVLLALRFLVLGTLGMVLLEPVLAWTLDVERSGRIMVAVDVSQSMETKDEQATDAEKLRTAQALGLIRPEFPVDEWCKAFEEKREPQWVSPAEEPDATRLAALSDSRRDTVREAMDEVSKLTRVEIARRLLENGETPLIKELSQLGLVEVCLFAGEASLLDPEALQRPLEPNGDSIRWNKTDLMQVMSAAPAERKGVKLAGVVVLSDGRDNAHPNDADYIKRFAGGAPIYPVLVGSERRPKDLSIANLDYPPTVFQNDKPILKATIRTSGLDGQEVAVLLDKLDADGQPVGEPVRQTVRAKEPSQDVQFDLTAETEGRQRYRIRTDEVPGETSTENNAREFAMQVVDDRSDVLLIEGEGRWEFRYLHAALSRDEHVHLDVVMFNQPYIGVLPDTFFPRELSEKGLNAQSKTTPFEGYDLVIVGDVSPKDMPNEVWVQLDRYVREEGGSLIFSAGKNYFPLSFNNPIIDGLLPVSKLRQVDLKDATQRMRPQERGFHLALTPDGERQTMLQFDTDPIANRKIWSELPGHPWGLVGEAKPGASVWTTLKGEKSDPGLDWERNNAVFVQQYQGTGQVIWLGIDSTWRFRFRVGDAYHHRFWGQISRWASEFKASAGNEFVRLGLERPVIGEGDDAVIIARWDQRFLDRFPKLQARAVLKLGGIDSKHPSITVDLKPDPERPLVQTGRAPSLRAGEYSVQLSVENAEVGPSPISAELSVLEKLSPELADVSGNRPLLEQLATTTGGQFYPIDQARRLVEKFQQVKESLTERKEIPLWNSGFVFLVFCGLLMTEWVLRKMNGLP
ncbi:MAG: hypothetical protein U0929_18090 [Planctomycetaceae bacterium]